MSTNKGGRRSSAWNDSVVQKLCEEVYLDRLEYPGDVEKVRAQPEKLAKRAKLYEPLVRSVLTQVDAQGLSIADCRKQDA